MITFKTDICPKCGRRSKLMLSNNPLSGPTICFDCINSNLNFNNLEHAEFFCRTYNLPWYPDTWLSLVPQYQGDTWAEYTTLMLEDKVNHPNLAYTTSTHDLWTKTNKEWEKCRSFAEILNKLQPIKDGFIDRGRLKWGEQYTFEDLIKLDSIYSRTLRANNITNPMQKEAVKLLCKLQIEMDEAIRMKDAKAIKDFSTAWATYAKQANLDQMINESKTDDITTVAELYDYMEKQGFIMKFKDNIDRDEIDFAIKDIQDTNRRLIIESTGLQSLLEDMIRQKTKTAEEEHTAAITEKDKLQDLLDFQPDDGEIDTEDDTEATSLTFDAEPSDPQLQIKRKEPS